MRRFALLGLCALTLSGCAFHEWDRLPYVAGTDPYAPGGDTENMRRALGQPIVVAPLKPDSGNVWPGPLPPTPTLADLQRQESQGQLSPLQSLPGQPEAPGLPAQRGGLGPLGPLHPVVPNVPPLPGVGASPGVAPRTGGVVQTPQGPGVTSGGTGAFSTLTLPNGMTGIVVPNGNGTSTVILGNGQVQTIPAPK
ncbi:MAG: hypothetical protein ABI369_09365 [Acetobacteraceae bacterium]